MQRLVEPKETVPVRSVGEELEKADNGVFARRARLRVALPLGRVLSAGPWSPGVGAAPAQPETGSSHCSSRDDQDGKFLAGILITASC